VFRLKKSDGVKLRNLAISKSFTWCFPTRIVLPSLGKRVFSALRINGTAPQKHEGRGIASAPGVRQTSGGVRQEFVNRVAGFGLELVTIHGFLTPNAVFCPGNSIQALGLDFFLAMQADAITIAVDSL